LNFYEFLLEKQKQSKRENFRLIINSSPSHNRHKRSLVSKMDGHSTPNLPTAAVTNADYARVVDNEKASGGSSMATVTVAQLSDSQLKDGSNIATATMAQLPEEDPARNNQNPYVTAAGYYGTAGSREAPFGVPEETVHITERDARLHVTWSLGRSIRFLACIDGFFLFLNYIGYAPLTVFLFCWGPLSGYQAGRDFNASACKLYVVYYFLRVSFDMFVIIDFVPTPYWMIFNLLIDIFITFFVRRFLLLLSHCSERDIDEVRAFEINDLDFL